MCCTQHSLWSGQQPLPAEAGKGGGSLPFPAKHKTQKSSPLKQPDRNQRHHDQNPAEKQLRRRILDRHFWRTVCQDRGPVTRWPVPITFRTEADATMFRLFRSDLIQRSEDELF
jgi:hypothetical protein